MVTIVDDDVDIRSASDVEWAMATRLNPQTGIVAIANTFGHGLNPSFPDYFGHKVGFDACRAFPFRTEHDRAFTKTMAIEGLDIAVKDVLPPKPAVAAKPARKGRSGAASGGAAM